jgi:hypothetical protein
VATGDHGEISPSVDGSSVSVLKGGDRDSDVDIDINSNEQGRSPTGTGKSSESLPSAFVHNSESHLHDLLHSTLSFNQFIEVSYTPSVSDLLSAYLLGVGIICRRNQVGVDLVILAMLPLPAKSTGVKSKLRKWAKAAQLTADNDIAFNAREQRSGVFNNSQNLVFAELSARVTQQQGAHFGDIENMKYIWNSMTSMASKLLDNLSDEERFSLVERMSALLVQVKNSADNSAEDDANVTPERSAIRDVCGTWRDPKWSKGFVALKHVLLSNTAKLEVMNTTSTLQYGLVLKGFDEDKQPCTTGGVAEAMLQVVDTFVNHCITDDNSLDSRFVAAAIIDFKHKIGDDEDPCMAASLSRRITREARSKRLGNKRDKDRDEL